MVEIPVDELVVGDPGRALCAPELRRPREHTEVLVEPVVRAALDDLLRVVLEVVEDRDGRIAGDLRRLFADPLVRTQVVGRQIVVPTSRIRAQMHARRRVIADVAAYVRTR